MSPDHAQPADDPLGLLLRQAHRRAAAALSDALAPMGLTGAHFGVLIMLSRHGVATQKQLIAALGSDQTAMVRTIDHLDQRGFLTRTRSHTDRRMYDLSLTPAGAGAYQRASALAHGAEHDVFGHLTSAERTTLANLLRRVGISESDRIPDLAESG